MNTTIFYIILHIKIILCKISAQTDNVLDQIFPKRYFPSRNEKVTIIIELRIFKLAFVPNFCLIWKFWFFWPDLQFYIFRLVWCEISAQTDNFDFLDQIFPKRYFRSKTEKVNSIAEFFIFKLVCAKLQLKMTIFFLDQIYPKWYFQSKTEKLNIISEFYIYSN